MPALQNAVPDPALRNRLTAAAAQPAKKPEQQKQQNGLSKVGSQPLPGASKASGKAQEPKYGGKGKSKRGGADGNEGDKGAGHTKLGKRKSGDTLGNGVPHAGKKHGQGASTAHQNGFGKQVDDSKGKAASKAHGGRDNKANKKAKL